MAIVFDGYDVIHSTKSVKHSPPGEELVAPDIKTENLKMKVLEKKRVSPGC